MIALDTNGLSEAVRSAPARRVLDWLAAQPPQIAAIARTHGAAVATRNVGDFQDCGIKIVDPWHA
jgi:predicted nucleic acid-binding protein